MFFKIFFVFLLILNINSPFFPAQGIERYFKPKQGTTITLPFQTSSSSQVDKQDHESAPSNQSSISFKESNKANTVSRKRHCPNESLNEQPKKKRLKRVVASYTVSLLKEYNPDYDFYIDDEKRSTIIDMDAPHYVPGNIPFLANNEEVSESEESAKEEATLAKKRNYSIILKKKVGNMIKYAEYKVRNIPRWSPYFEDMNQHFDTKEKAIHHPDCELMSGLIFAKIADTNAGIGENRVFVSIFGNGRHLLANGAEDFQFGLITALNTINPRQIKKTAKFHKGPQALFRTEYYIKWIAASDISRDGLLKNISGKSISGFLGEGTYSISTNGINLNLGRDFLLDSFEQECAKLYESYKKAPLREFEWIKEIRPIKDRNEIARLDSLLTQDILNQIIRDNDYSMPLLKEGIEIYENAKSFKWRKGKKFYNSFNEMFSKKAINSNIDDLKKWNIECFDNSGNMISRFKAGDCINYERETSNGSLRVFSEGIWYAISDEFARSLNNEIDELKVDFSDLGETVSSDFIPVEYIDKQGNLKRKIKLEENYVKRIVKNNPDSLYLMDQRDVGGNLGKGTIEVCDILSASIAPIGYKRLIHVKDWTKSATFSHLCSQSIRSAENLVKKNFRQRAKKTFIRYEAKTHLTHDSLQILGEDGEPIVKSFMSTLDEKIKKVNNNQEIRAVIENYLRIAQMQLSCSIEKIDEYLNTLDDLLLINQKFKPEQYMVVLALIHKNGKTISSCLPFFSKLNLRDTARSLRELKYNVGFTFIKKK